MADTEWHALDFTKGLIPMSKTRFFRQALFFLVIAMLILSVTGCREKKAVVEDPTPPPAPEEIISPKEDEPLLIYSSVARVAPFIREFRAVESAGFIHYLYEGDESIDGVLTSKVSLTLNYSEHQKLTVWICEEGIIRKAVSEPESILPTMLEIMNLSEFVDMWFAPFLDTMFRYVGLTIDDVLLAIKINFGDYEVLGKDTFYMGDLTGDIYTVALTREEPEKLYFADFGTYILAVGGEKIRNGEWTVMWEVTEYSLR